ncbi:MAG: isoprenyl transferase [Bacteroidales bacterium]|nr:isoprenyl transferase [Bacteroidales bacterium]
MSIYDNIDYTRIPTHTAIIMDGNGRWATSKGLERGEGHREGVRAITRVVEAASKVSIKYLTLYAFSTENWNRPIEEVNGLMDLMVYAINQETENLKKNGVKVICIGDMNRLPEYASTALNECIYKTREGDKLTLIIALSYSSKWELTDATRKIADDVTNGVLKIDDISEETISMYLTTRSIPDPDLLIRTGGEQRISNFLLWQCAYAEFYFTDVYWPDFGEKDLYDAVIDFQRRERRFGKINDQIEYDEK